MAIIDTKTTNINTIFLFIFIFEYLHYTHHLDLNANVPDIFPALFPGEYGYIPLISEQTDMLRQCFPIPTNSNDISYYTIFTYIS